MFGCVVERVKGELKKNSMLCRKKIGFIKSSVLLSGMMVNGDMVMGFLSHLCSPSCGWRMACRAGGSTLM